MVSPVLCCLLVYASTYPKIYIGPRDSTGYVIADLPTKYDHFVSVGIDLDNDFEINLIDRYSGLQCDAFDQSIKRLSTPNHRIAFHQKTLVDVSYLHHYLDTYTNLFVKMNIGCQSQQWLSMISDTQLRSIAQLVINWEFTSEPTVGEFNLLERLATSHRLVHFHPNNLYKFYIVDGIKIPKAFKGTYVRNDIQRNTSLSNEAIPSVLDYAIAKWRSDYIITWEPFVNSSPYRKLWLPLRNDTDDINIERGKVEL